MTIIAAGPIGIRPTGVHKQCEAHKGHAHNYDHTTIVIRGRVRVFSRGDDGEDWKQHPGEYGQGRHFVVKAKVFHRIVPLEDNTIWFCVFSHRDFDDGMVIEEYNGNPKSYE